MIKSGHTFFFPPWRSGQDDNKNRLWLVCVGKKYSILGSKGGKGGREERRIPILMVLFPREKEGEGEAGARGKMFAKNDSERDPTRQKMKHQHLVNCIV